MMYVTQTGVASPTSAGRQGIPRAGGETSLLMVSGTDAQHAICVTDDEEAVAARLRAVLGLPPGAETLSWERRHRRP